MSDVKIYDKPKIDSLLSGKADLVDGKVPAEQLPSMPGGSGVWGQITGNLPDQTDLTGALESKLDKSGGTMTGNLFINANHIAVGDEHDTNSTLLGNGFIIREKAIHEEGEETEAVIAIRAKSGTLALTSDIPVKISDMRDENGNPTTKTAMKLGADGSLKINYRSGTEYHGLELTGLSDDFYAYDEYNGGHLPDPYIGKWKGPFNVGGQAGNVFVPENQPDPKTEEEALQGWVVWYAYGPDSAQLMYKTGAITRDFSLNADTIDAQGTGKTETWSSMYIIGHAYFTREQGTVHERTMADMDALNNKANISDFAPADPADYVTNFVQQSAILQARIKSVAQSLIRTAFANFDPNEQSFADLVNILKNIGA